MPTKTGTMTDQYGGDINSRTVTIRWIDTFIAHIAPTGRRRPQVHAMLMWYEQALGAHAQSDAFIHFRCCVRLRVLCVIACVCACVCVVWCVCVCVCGVCVCVR